MKIKSLVFLFLVFSPLSLHAEVSCDGLTDVISANTLGNFGGSGLNTFSVSLWINTTTNTATQYNVFGTVNTGVTTTIGLDLNRGPPSQVTVAGDTEFIMRDDNGKNFSTYIAHNIYDGNWHHLAIVVSNAGTNSATFYVDAISSGTNDLAQSPVTFSNFQFPMCFCAQNLRGPINSFSKIKLDDVRILNYALSAREVQTLYNSRARYPLGDGRNTVIYLPLDDVNYSSPLSTGPITFKDYSGNGYDGTWTGPFVGQQQTILRYP